MTAPNIVNVANILGKTSTQDVTTVASNLVENAASSNSVYKINSIIVSNVDGVNAADITVDHFRNSNTTSIASTITVPADSTLIVLSKETSIYLEEGDAIRCTASANSDLQALCSYEIIS